MASQWPPKKNTAFTLYFTLYKNDGTVIANPGTYTKKVSKDGGAIADISGSVTEVDTTYGLCSIGLSSSEMNADAVWVQIKDDTAGCVPFTTVLYTTGSLHDEVKSDTAAILADTGTDGVVIADGGITAAKIASNTITASALGANTLTAAKVAADVWSTIADAVWDETANEHLTVGTFGQRFAVAHQGTAQAGAGSTITLAAGASATDDLYNEALIVVTGGTGAGQSNIISDYNGTTKVATVSNAWRTNPSSDSTYVIIPSSTSPAPVAGVVDANITKIGGADVNAASAQLGVNVVNWKGAAAPAMTGDAYARLGAPAGASVSADIAAVKSDSTAILADTGTDGVVIADGGITAAKIASNTITASALAADAGAEIAGAVWNEDMAGHSTAGSAGAALTAAGSAGDPWSATLPGAYGAGTAGKLVGDNLDAKVSTRASQASVDDVPTVAEFNARTLPSADYVVTSDTIAGVTTVGSVTGNVGGNVVGSVGSVGSGVTLTAGAIDAILDETIGDGTLTMRQALRVMIAALGAKLSGAGTTTVTIRNAADSANVIVATVDADGNRSAVTLTP